MVNSIPAPEAEEINSYKGVVEKIKNLNWKNLTQQELEQLMYLSYQSALEFAEALRVTLEVYPNDANLKSMAHGELQTNNLEFEDYKQTGDHANFLAHFLKKNNLASNHILSPFSGEYRDYCRRLPDEVRAMTIFSREEELSGIFKKILEAKDWSTPALLAFRYYLEKHIELDTESGGHHDLTKNFPIDNTVKPFYETRLNMYKAIPKLFEEA